MEPVQKKYDIGVIVGRFQAPDLHQGHRDLIETVMDNHQQILIFLGLSPARSTLNNPLDFETRRKMIQASYPDVNVLYIDDSPSDKAWSKRLDSQIRKLTSPASSVVLYGSRDSFISHYHGKYDTIELAQKVFTSATQIRNEVSLTTKGTEDFRLGVIYGVSNQYARVMPTVDVAIWNADHTELLMAQKKDEDKWRFIGGFADKGGSYEQDVRREISEEAHIEVTDINYVGSGAVDDWRYRGERDGIKTMLFETEYMHGKPTPDDDIEKLKWVRATDMDKEVNDTHRFLFEMLREKYPERF